MKEEFTRMGAEDFLKIAKERLNMKIYRCKNCGWETEFERSVCIQCGYVAWEDLNTFEEVQK